MENHNGSSWLLSRVRGHVLFVLSDDSHLGNLTGRKYTQHHKQRFLSEVKWKEDVQQRSLHCVQEGAELSLSRGRKTASNPESRAMTSSDQTEVPERNSCAPQVSQNTELSFEQSQDGVIDLTIDDEPVSESDGESTTPAKARSSQIILPGLSQLLLNRSSENSTRFFQENIAHGFFRETTAKSQDISVTHTQVFKVPTSPLMKQSRPMQASVSPVKVSSERTAAVTPADINTEFCSVGNLGPKVSTVGDDSRIDEGIVMESGEGESEEGDDVIVVGVEGEVGVRDEQIISVLRG